MCFSRNLRRASDKADRVVLCSLFAPEKLDASVRLDVARVVQELRARGIEAWQRDSADAIVQEVAPRLEGGDKVLIMSNGGFDGIHQKLLNALNHRPMAKSKILIVDDDPGILAMLQLMLRLEGYDAIVCGDPRLVVDTMASEKPDLVLLDALMPGFDGIQVLEAVKARALSITGPSRYGNANEAYLKLAMQAGAKGCWRSPL